MILKEGELIAKNVSHNLHSTPVTSPNGDVIQKETISISETIPGIIPHDKIAEMFPRLKNEETARKRLEVFILNILTPKMFWKQMIRVLLIDF